MVILKVMAPFYGWGSTASRLESLRGCSLLFTTKSPEIPGTLFINLGRVKGWVDLEATQWFWTRDPWNGNPAPESLGHCSILFIPNRLLIKKICTENTEATANLGKLKYVFLKYGYRQPSKITIWSSWKDWDIKY